MKKYKYTAVDKTGRTYDGDIKALTLEEAKLELAGKGLVIRKIAILKETRNFSKGLFKKKVKTKDIAIFCDHMSSMLDSGIPMIDVFDIMRKQTENPTLKEVIASMLEDLKIGTQLSKVLANYTETFPDIVVNMVRAGESTGNLDAVFARLATHFEKEYKIQKQLKSAMAYPSFLLGLTVIMVGILVTFVLPTFTKMFTDSGVALPGLTQGLINLSDLIRTKWYLLVPGIVSAIFVFKKVMKTEKAQDALDKIKLKLPVINKMIRTMYTTKFARTLSTLLMSGVTLVEALNITISVLGHKPTQVALRRVMPDIQQGVPLSKVLKTTELFPPMIDSMLTIGEETGSIDKLLVKTADFYDNELSESIKAVMGLIEPLMIVFMAAVIGVVVMAIALPMFDMVNTVK